MDIKSYINGYLFKKTNKKKQEVSIAFKISDDPLQEDLLSYQQKYPIVNSEPLKRKQFNLNEKRTSSLERKAPSLEGNKNEIQIKKVQTTTDNLRRYFEDLSNHHNNHNSEKSYDFIEKLQFFNSKLNGLNENIKKSISNKVNLPKLPIIKQEKESKLVTTQSRIVKNSKFFDDSDSEEDDADEDFDLDSDSDIELETNSIQKMSQLQNSFHQTIQRQNRVLFCDSKAKPVIEQSYQANLPHLPVQQKTFFNKKRKNYRSPDPNGKRLSLKTNDNLSVITEEDTEIVQQLNCNNNNEKEDDNDEQPERASPQEKIKAFENFIKNNTNQNISLKSRLQDQQIRFTKSLSPLIKSKLYIFEIKSNKKEGSNVKISMQTKTIDNNSYNTTNIKQKTQISFCMSSNCNASSSLSNINNKSSTKHV